MKKLLVICAAVAALVCACNKYDGAISDLEKRIESTEQSVNGLVSKVEALQSLINAIQSGVSIKSVVPVEGGFTVTFSDGNSFTVVNGKDGQPGQPGEDGEDGKDFEVSYTEDNLCYYFNFGDGKVIAVSKSGAFGIKAENTDVELESGVPTVVPFEVVGADETTKVILDGCPYDYKFVDGGVEISSAKAANGSFIIKAIRNSDGANSAVVITVTKAVPSDVTFAITVSDITKYGATVDVVPSNKDVIYIYSVETADYVNSFETAAELAEADLEYWEHLYETKYSSYANTFKDFVVEQLSYSGDIVGDSWEGYLDAGTDYVAYAFALDEDTLDLISSEIGKAEFSTLPEEELSDVTYLGVAIWHDALVGEIYGIEPTDLPVDVYEDNMMPGVYYFDSPYCAENVMSWFNDVTDPSQLSNNCHKAYISIDASNPDKVIFPYQELGILLSSKYGWASAGCYHNGETISTGVFAEGVISFSGSFDYGESLDPGPYTTNSSGEFKITMPDGDSAPAKPAAVKNAAKPVKSQGNKLFEVPAINR